MDEKEQSDRTSSASNSSKSSVVRIKVTPFDRLKGRIGKGYESLRIQEIWKSYPSLRDWVDYDERTNKAFCKYCDIEVSCSLSKLAVHAGSQEHLDAYKKDVFLGKCYEVFLLSDLYQRKTITKKAHVNATLVNKILRNKEKILAEFKDDLANINGIYEILYEFMACLLHYDTRISDTELMQNARLLTDILCVSDMQIDRNWAKLFRTICKRRFKNYSSAASSLNVGTVNHLSVRRILKDLENRLDAEVVKRFNEHLSSRSPTGDLILKCSKVHLAPNLGGAEDAAAIQVEPAELQIKEEIEIEENMLSCVMGNEMLVEAGENELAELVTDNDSNELIEIYAEVDGDEDEDGDGDQDQDQEDDEIMNFNETNIDEESETKPENDMTISISAEATFKSNQADSADFILDKIKEEPMDESASKESCQQPLDHNNLPEFLETKIKSEPEEITDQPNEQYEVTAATNELISNIPESPNRTLLQQKQNYCNIDTPVYPPDIKTEPYDTYESIDGEDVENEMNTDYTDLLSASPKHASSIDAENVDKIKQEPEEFENEHSQIESYKRETPSENGEYEMNIDYELLPTSPEQGSTSIPSENVDIKQEEEEEFENVSEMGFFNEDPPSETQQTEIDLLQNEIFNSSDQNDEVEVFTIIEETEDDDDDDNDEDDNDYFNYLDVVADETLESKIENDQIESVSVVPSVKIDLSESNEIQEIGRESKTHSLQLKKLIAKEEKKPKQEQKQQQQQQQLLHEDQPQGEQVTSDDFVLNGDVLRISQNGNSLTEQQVTQIGRLLNGKNYNGAITCDALWLDPIICSYMVSLSNKPTIFNEAVLIDSIQQVLGENFVIQSANLTLYRHMVLLAYSTKYPLIELTEIVKNIFNESVIRTILTHSTVHLEIWRLFLKTHVMTRLYRKAFYEMLFEYQRRAYLMAVGKDLEIMTITKGGTVKSLNKFLKFRFNVNQQTQKQIVKIIRQKIREWEKSKNVVEYEMEDLSWANIFKDIKMRLPMLVVGNLTYAWKKRKESIQLKQDDVSNKCHAIVTAIKRKMPTSETSVKNNEIDLSAVDVPAKKQKKLKKIKKSGQVGSAGAIEDKRTVAGQSDTEDAAKYAAAILSRNSVKLTSDNNIVTSGNNDKGTEELEIANIKKFESRKSQSNPTSLIPFIQYDPIIAAYLLHCSTSSVDSLPIFSNRVLVQAAQEVFGKNYVFEEKNQRLYQNLILVEQYHNHPSYKSKIDEIISCVDETTIRRELARAAQTIREWQLFFKKNLARILYRKAIFEMLYEFTKRYLQTEDTISHELKREKAAEIQSFLCCKINLPTDWISNFDTMFMRRVTSHNSFISYYHDNVSLDLKAIYEFVKDRFNFFIKDTLASVYAPQAQLDNANKLSPMAMVEKSEHANCALKANENTANPMEKFFRDGLRIYFKVQLEKDPVIISYFKLLSIKKKPSCSKLPSFDEDFLRYAFNQNLTTTQAAMLSADHYILYRQLILFKYSKQYDKMLELSRIMKCFTLSEIRQYFNDYESIFQRWRKFTRRFLLVSVLKHTVYEMLHEHTRRLYTISEFPGLQHFRKKAGEVIGFFGQNFNIPQFWMSEFYTNIVNSVMKSEQSSVKFVKKDLTLDEIYLIVKDRLHWFAIEKRIDALYQSDMTTPISPPVAAADKEVKPKKNLMEKSLLKKFPETANEVERITDSEPDSAVNIGVDILKKELDDARFAHRIIQNCIAETWSKAKASKAPACKAQALNALKHSIGREEVITPKREYDVSAAQQALKQYMQQKAKSNNPQRNSQETNSPEKKTQESESESLVNESKRKHLQKLIFN